MHRPARRLAFVPVDEQDQHRGAAADDVAGVAADAAAFGRLFEQAYLRFHRRDGKRSGLTGASRAVLLHLALTGPLTVGEAARHLDRAQSVVRLTPQGLDRLERDRDVLGRELLERAMSALPPQQRTALLQGLQALLAADPPPEKETP
jgi:DNA-binding MarR family transcriptional regulator